MRFVGLTLSGALAVAALSASTSAAPTLPKAHAPDSANLIQVSGGCGPAYHRNPWGYCVPNPYGYYGWYGYYQPYYYRPHGHRR